MISTKNIDFGYSKYMLLVENVDRGYRVASAEVGGCLDRGIAADAVKGVDSLHVLLSASVP